MCCTWKGAVQVSRAVLSNTRIFFKPASHTGEFPLANLRTHTLSTNQHSSQSCSKEGKARSFGFGFKPVTIICLHAPNGSKRALKWLHLSGWARLPRFAVRMSAYTWHQACTTCFNVGPTPWHPFIGPIKTRPVTASYRMQ